MTPQVADGKAVLGAPAELNIYHAAAFRDALIAAFNSGADVEIDLAQTGEMDAAGLQLLLLAHRESAAHGRALTLRAPSEAVQDVLGLCNVASWFAIAPGAAG